MFSFLVLAPAAAFIGVSILIVLYFAKDRGSGHPPQ